MGFPAAGLDLSEQELGAGGGCGVFMTLKSLAPPEHRSIFRSILWVMILLL